ncbi:MAG: rhodanese-like domain-containing protein [Burkholderiales bacterium]
MNKLPLLLPFNLIAALTLLASSFAFAQAITEIDVTKAATQIQDAKIKVLDVREPSEFAAGHIKDAMLIPLGQVEKRVAELEGFKDQPMIVVCGSGGRSATAVKTLSKYGFTQLQNLKGGMGAWRKAGLPIAQ